VRKHDRVVWTSRLGRLGPGGWIWIAAMVLFWAGLLAATACCPPRQLCIPCTRMANRPLRPG